jgi:hypothetical protein
MPAHPRNEVVPRDSGGNGTLFAAGPTPVKDNTLLYAAGDVVVYVGMPNVGCPLGFEDPATITGNTYRSLGWVNTSGFIFKLDETIKDIPAAGVLTPIRSILTGGTKTVQANILEALNPYARSLFDDVPIFPLANSPLKPTGIAAPVAPTLATAATGGTVLAGTYQVITTYVTAAGESGASPSASQVTTGSVSTLTVTSPVTQPGVTGWNAYVTQAGGSVYTRQNASPLTIGTPFVLTAPPTSTGAVPPSGALFPASYVIPDPPADNRYGLIFDSHDGFKQMRLYAPYTKVTARGNDQVQQADIEPLDLTWTFYPGTINDGTNPSVTGVAKRFINYGQDMSVYFQ